jgi:hypothetical protein
MLLRRITEHVKEQNWFAVGIDFIIVVIGILIALQIANWSEQEKEKNEAIEIRLNLIQEFEQNREVLKARIDLIKNSLNYSYEILAFFGQSMDQLNEANIDKTLLSTLFYGNFNPANSTISDILQSGRLRLIKDNQLKHCLDQWLQLLEDTDEDFRNQDVQANEYFLPYLNSNIAMRNLEVHGDLIIVSEKSVLLEDYYYKIFNDFKFENLMISHIGWNTIMLGHYENLDQLALEIVTHIQQVDN